jgi:hypothetical protein
MRTKSGARSSPRLPWAGSVVGRTPCSAGDPLVPLRTPGAHLAFDDPGRAAPARLLLRRLPPLAGETIRIVEAAGLRDRHGPVHAGSFVRERRIACNCSAREFPRVLCHELFHFVWVRAGNTVRRNYETVLAGEWRAGACGELGWSSEWRRERLTAADVASRSRRWRDYCCESFCDTAAWLYCGRRRHPEFTLAEGLRLERGRWFAETLEGGLLSI